MFLPEYQLPFVSIAHFSLVSNSKKMFIKIGSLELLMKRWGIISETGNTKDFNKDGYLFQNDSGIAQLAI